MGALHLLLLFRLARTSWDKTRRRQQQFGELLLLTGTFVGLFLLGSGHGLRLLFSRRQSLVVWVLTGMVLLIVVLVLVWPFLLMRRYFWKPWQHLYDAALALRAAAEAGDAHLAPLAAEQPAPLMAEEVSAWPTRYLLTKSKAPKRCLPTLLGCGGFLVLGGGVGLVLMTVFLLNGMVGPTPHSPLGAFTFDTLSLAMLFLILVCLGLGYLVFAWWGPHNAPCVATQQDLQWRGSGWWGKSRITIGWQEIRSFFLITARFSTSSHWQKAYILDTHEAILMWHISHETLEEDLAVHHQFCRLVVTYTSLPLRDLTEAAHATVHLATHPGPLGVLASELHPPTQGQS